MLKVLSQVMSHTTIRCVDFIVGTLKMVVKYSPRGKHVYICT